MDNSKDFKDLWAKQTISPPDTGDLYLKLNNIKKKSVRKLVLINILLLATCAFIIFIWYYYQPQLITTKIGIVLIILAMVVYLFAYNQLFTLYMKIDINQSNNEYVQNLISIKTKQHFLQSGMLSVYTILFSFGICLYMYEYTARMTTFQAIFAYAITLSWIGFNWFYIRLKTIKKQQNKLDELIRKFENVQQQLQDE